MIRAACRYAQKRKMLSPDESTQQDESCDFERNATPKKIRMEFRQPCSEEEVETSSNQLPAPQESQATGSRRTVPEKRKGLDDYDSAWGTEPEELVKDSCTSPSLSRSPSTRKRRKTLSPVENKLGNAIRYEDACLRTTWQSNFLRKCAELVEERFRGAIRITCVKPFYVQFSTCWQDSNAVLRLETSDLPAHQECRAYSNEKYDASRDAFSTKETDILVRNFFQISRAYSLRHPYLIAGIQTGLETRKEIYDFHKFKTAHQIIEKLCVDILEKDSRACLLQLRTLLMPQMLPCGPIEAEEIIAHLFAGFGPDWNTLSKLTGFDHVTLKTAVAGYHNMDLETVTARSWYDVHRQILDAYDIDSGVLKSSESSSRSPSPQYSPPNPCQPSQCQLGGDPSETQRIRLPSFRSVFAPL